MKPLASFLLCVLLSGCTQRQDDGAFQQRMKDWTAEKDKQAELLTQAVHRLTQLQLAPQPKFHIVSVTTDYYIRTFRIDELTGESWLYLDGKSNSVACWLKLDEYEYPTPKPTTPLSGYDWILNDPLFQKSNTNGATTN